MRIWTEALVPEKGAHRRSQKEGDIDMEDAHSDSSTVSSVPTPTSLARGKPLCGIRIHSSPPQVTLNESIILPPFHEISRIARQGQDDRRKYNTPSAYHPSFNSNLDGISWTAEERCANSYTSVPTKTGIFPKSHISSVPCPTSVPLPSRSPSPLALPHLPPLPMALSDSPQVAERSLLSSTKPINCRSIPGSDWDNYVPPEHGSVESYSGVTMTHCEPQFDPLEARHRPEDEECTTSEEVAFCYDPVESNWQKHCVRIFLDDGKAQFRCTWIRDDTKSGKCEYQGKRQLVQRHIETTHLNIRRYICLWPGCNQRYGQKSAFDVHRRTHTGERPFKCKKLECQARFNDPAGLLRHMVQEHQYKPKARKSNYPNGHLPITTNRPRNRRHDSP